MSYLCKLFNLLNNVRKVGGLVLSRTYRLPFWPSCISYWCSTE